MKLPSHRSARRPRPNSFSLLEILVAVGILALIIVGLLAMFYQTQRAFRSGSMQVDVLESGRAISQLLSRELQELTVPGQPGMINLAAVSYLPLVLPLTSGGNGATREYRLQDLAFLTFRTRTNDEWVGTVYAIGDAGPNAGLGVGTLYRYSMNFPFDPSSSPSNTLYQSYTNLQRQFYAARPTGPLSSGFHRVADGIVHFKLLAYDADGLLYNRSFPSNSGGLGVVNLGTVVGQNDYDYYFTNYLPSYLDLELGVLDPRAVAQFRTRVVATNLPVQFGNPVAWSYLTNHVGSIHLFKQRIPIRNSPTDAP
jgi:hypothetical protein